MTQRPDHIFRKAAAFTLVELSLVLFILVLIGAVAIPRFAGFATERRLEGAASRITADLEFARRRARSTNKPLTIRFFAVSNRYMLLDVPNPDHPSDPNYSVDLRSAPYEAEMAFADFGGDGDVVFDAYGLPDTGGSVIVRVGQRTKTVTLDQTTGFARAQ